jgi:DNA repair protein RecN (Recombination protein N)
MRLGVITEEVKDIASEMQLLSEKISLNPERLNEVQSRLDLIYNLMRKHRVNSIEELQDIISDLESFELMGKSIESDLSLLKESRDTLIIKLKVESEKLSKMRQAILQKYSAEATDLLADLGMPYAQFKIKLIELEVAGENGREQVQFMFSANKGIEPLPLAKAASGGELSRVMLVINRLVAGKTGIPTLIFDEIDTGISGQTAIQMAEMLYSISSQCQIIAVTHLPQVAAKGNCHFNVYKHESEGKTYTGIVKLNETQRIKELAAMMQGEKAGETAMQNARELLNT